MLLQSRAAFIRLQQAAGMTLSGTITNFAFHSSSILNICNFVFLSKYTALHICCESGHLDVCKFLVESRANIEAEDSRCNTRSYTRSTIAHSISAPRSIHLIPSPQSYWRYPFSLELSRWGLRRFCIPCGERGECQR
jgi:hypothetical protein